MANEEDNLMSQHSAEIGDWIAHFSSGTVNDCEFGLKDNLDN